MTKKKYGIFVILIIILPVAIYIWHYWGTSLSSQTQDWGSFGNYFCMGTGIVSVILLYITYCEQRRANCISQFEQLFNVQCNTIKERLYPSQGDMEQINRLLQRHFSKESMPNISNSDLILALSFYYTDLKSDYRYNGKKWLVDKNTEYFLHLLKMTDNRIALSDEMKKEYIFEIVSLLPSEFLTILFFYVCYIENKETWRLIKKYNVFREHLTHNQLLDSIINKIISSNVLHKSLIINPNNIVFNSLENEQLDETVIRLKSDK